VDNDPPKSSEHHYHSEATVLRGHLHLPLRQHIHPQAFARLPEEGGYISQHAHDYELERVISYTRAYTQVAGNQEIKHGRGFNTLATAVVENLNVLDVVTADRIVGQLSTEHPLVGHTPRISLLGTRFENLRIAGHPVNFDFDRGDLDLDFFGDRPGDDTPYTRNPTFRHKVSKQHAHIRRQHNEHPESIAALFDDLKDRFSQTPESFADNDGQEEAVECSFVNQASGYYPGHTCGHVIHIPHFGTLYLGVLHIHHTPSHPQWKTPATTVELSMIKMRLGCSIAGTTDVATAKTNGGSKPIGG
jgi:hypothetical protein